MSLQQYWHALWMSLIVEHIQWLLFLSGNHCVWGFLDLYPLLFVWPTMMDFCKEAPASLDLICWTRCPHSAHWTKVCVCCGSTSPLLTLLFVKSPPVPTGCGELFSKTISSNVVIILKMLRMQSSMILRAGGSGIECVGTDISWRVVSKPSSEKHHVPLWGISFKDPNALALGLTRILAWRCAHQCNICSNRNAHWVCLLCSVCLSFSVSVSFSQCTFINKCVVNVALSLMYRPHECMCCICDKYTTRHGV